MTDIVKRQDFSDIANLQVSDSFKRLIETMPEHKEMIGVIKESLPEIQRASSLFYKTQSQFMDNMMTVSNYTPIRNLRQILAQMVQTRAAIKEASFKMQKNGVKLKMKQRELENETDELKCELLQIKINEIYANAEDTTNYISGAIRQLTNYTEQYKSIMEKHKLHGFNEADFEKEEERYHIMKAFEQAVCAARTRHDRSIDEGNMIYLTQIGINGTSAQREIHDYLASEDRIINDQTDPKVRQEPTHANFLVFLHRMAEKYAGSAKTFAEVKGMSTASDSAMVQKGDSRLLIGKEPDEWTKIRREDAAND